MKLPRWLVGCLIGTSVLTVLVAAGWWWSTWPEWTLREFVALSANGQFEDTNGMLKPPLRWVTYDDGDLDFSDDTGLSLLAARRSVWESSFQKAQHDFKLDSRGPMDIVLGRARVTLLDLPSTATPNPTPGRWRLAGWVIGAERGRVSVSLPDHAVIRPKPKPRPASSSPSARRRATELDEGAEAEDQPAATRVNQEVQ